MNGCDRNSVVASEPPLKPARGSQAAPSYGRGAGRGQTGIVGGMCVREWSPRIDLLTPFHVFRQVRPGEAVLIHGTLPPAHLHARQYWTEPALAKLAAGDNADPTQRLVRRSSRRTP